MADALAGLGHPRGDGVAPAEVVLGLLVGGVAGLVAVGFVEKEAGGVFLGTEHVETEVAGLLTGVGGVVVGGFDEGINELVFDEEGDADDVHGRAPSGRWGG